MLDEALVAAVQSKDRPAILSLLKQGANPNVDYTYPYILIDEPKIGTAPLLFAVLGWEYNRCECFTAAVGFIKRIVVCDPVVVRAFLEAGGNADAELRPGDTLLRFAVRQCEPEIVRLLLEHGADLRTRLGRPYLAEAAGNCRADAVRLLLDRGVSVDERDNCGRTALMAAISDRRGGDSASQTATMVLLLAAKADVNAADAYGDTALMWAAERNCVGVARLLIEHGADVSTRRYHGANALIQAAGSRSPDPTERARNVEMVKLLAASGMDVNAKDDSGKTALMAAVSHASGTQSGFQVAALTALLEAHADANLADARGRTALTEAAGCNNVASVRLLLQHGADTNARDSEGANALMAAVDSLPKRPLERVCQVETAKVLLAAGIDVNASTTDGTTALMIAADAGNLDLIRLLLSHGADIDARDAHGRTARKRATTDRHPDAADLLRRSERS